MTIAGRLPPSPELVENLLAVRNGVKDIDSLDGSTQSLLIDYFLSQMPYGTAKARDGDPFEWITIKLSSMGLHEFNSMFDV